ncbi:HAD family hydrolase [Marinilabilia rubra]|uniref:HAD family hydrolase n=1 Tax=Marinilabilia rubra TaxID=2162893 RepID=A0A2U2BEF5_9BACT|nr:HAD family hydrolase [Marinilabilia rubra]
MNTNFEVIAFDADDTLWMNEPYFRGMESDYCRLLSKYGTEEEISAELLKTVIKNLELYGYGVKGFVLSMIETAQKKSKGEVDQQVIAQILELGKSLLQKPVEILDGVHEVLQALSEERVKLIVATKGDLLDQERKLAKSGLEKYFHHVEVMSDKKEDNYRKLLAHLDIAPEDFLMVGNSLKSDIVPVLNIGAHAVYVPYHVTWTLEEVEKPDNLKNFEEISHLVELLDLLRE